MRVSGREQCLSLTMMKKRVFPKEQDRRQRRKRIAVVVLFFAFCLSGLVYRCLNLHLSFDPRLEKIARSQYKAKIEEAPPRGNIYDASGEELAVSVPAYSLAGRPGRMDPAEFSQIAAFIGMSEKDFAFKVDKEKKYVWIKRHLAPEASEQILKGGFKGIELVKGTQRFYPNREVASQLLGAVGTDNEGLSGLELFYDRYLRGAKSDSTAFRDARGKTFETEETLGERSGDPNHLHLTIRKNIQYAAEKELNAQCGASRAKSCSAVVLDVRTGAVLAMASYPSFNANSYQSYDMSLWRNLIVTDTFEPGSTFKTFVVGAALDSGLVRPQDKFFCENGALKIGKWTINDHERYGMMSVRDIIKVSSNIGAYKVGAKLGKTLVHKAVKLFGFGQKTGIDYPGEVHGYIPPINSWQEVQFANIAFGQGIRTTALQLATAYAAIANSGVRLKPYIVSRVTDAGGQTLLQIKPKAEQTVFKPETAKTLIEVLKGVTEEGGTATKAALPGYEIAGKTGTAQKVVDGRYSHTKFLSSFVGIVPADEPRLVVMVAVDEPQGETYAGLVAAPVFKKIAWAAVVDLGIPPSHPSPSAPAPLKAAQPPLEAAKVPRIQMAGLVTGASFGVSEEGESTFDLKGHSKRKVMSILEQRRRRCELIGSGVAVSQSTSGGCRIYFRED